MLFDSRSEFLGSVWPECSACLKRDLKIQHFFDVAVPDSKQIAVVLSDEVESVVRRNRLLSDSGFDLHSFLKLIRCGIKHFKLQSIKCAFESKEHNSQRNCIAPNAL